MSTTKRVPQSIVSLLTTLLSVAFVCSGLSACASKEKQAVVVAEEAPVPTRTIVRSVPERANDLQITTAIEDLFALAGVNSRSIEISSANGYVSLRGEATASRELDAAIALISKIKGVREVRAELDGGTVSGSTTAVEEGPGFLSWFVTLFWPILTLIGAAFAAIAFLYIQTRIIKNQIAKKRGLTAL